MHSTSNSLSDARVGVVGAGRLGGALAGALRGGGRGGRGPGRARRGRRRGCDAIVLCVPDGEIPAAVAAVAGAAPLVGHTSGATPLRTLAPAAPRSGCTPPDLRRRLERPGRVRGRGLCRRGLHAGGARLRRRSRAHARDDALRDRRRRPRRLPRGCVGRLQLPGHAAGRRRADRRGRRPRARGGPGAAGAAAAAHGRQRRRAGSRGGAHRPRRARRRATVASQRRAVADVAPELLDLFDELVHHTRALAAAGARA